MSIEMSGTNEDGLKIASMQTKVLQDATVGTRTLTEESTEQGTESALATGNVLSGQIELHHPSCWVCAYCDFVYKTLALSLIAFCFAFIKQSSTLEMPFT